MQTDKWKLVHTLAVLVLTAGIVVVGAFSTYGDADEESRWGLWAFIILAAILLALLAVIGHGLVRRFDGALIDSRFRISLAQFQLTMWTVLVLAAWGAAVFTNLGIEDADNPFAVSIPSELWLALGISAASFGGAKLVQAKELENPPADPGPTESEMLEARGQDVSDWKVRGKLLAHRGPDDARWGDLFAADGADSGGLPEVSKMQMFFFTVVLVFGYAVACADVFATAGTEPIDGLPALDEAFVVLLGISQGGYLVKKGVDLRV